ncbi:MAG: YdeI/OmpD-associated family protein [Micrococcales bacterium]
MKRAVYAMPADVKLALELRGLRADYDHRPAYQRNDYIAWIERAVRKDIRLKRMNQMLDELEKGGVYMRMDHPASRKRD